VMPGGLTRVASSARARIVSMQRGGGSKDTWVMSPGQVDTSFTLLRTTVTAADLVRAAPSGVPSRLAENLFWLGRYAERCDDMARLLRLALGLTLQDGEDEENAQAPLQELALETGLLQPSDAPDAALLQAALPIAGAWPSDLPPPTKPPPGFTVLAFHGERDSRIPFADGEDAVKRLASAGYHATMASFPGVGHRVPEAMRVQIIEALDGLLGRALAGSTKSP